ncbi:MAG: hypothetical protein QOI36_2342 [Pseudonocardiales bacterium]|nr:Helix-turn-helix, AraC domain protein [Pseudonocardia sp.]MDT7650936.1 hypothetical protein [Pseudonocardiales bacterium]
MDELGGTGPAPHPVGVQENSVAEARHTRLPEAGTSYTVAVPVHGAVEVSHRAHTVEADAARAAVLQPEGDSDMSFGAGFSCYLVTIDTGKLKDVLEHRLGHTVRRPPDLSESLDLRTPAGRAWARVAGLLVSSPVLRHPVLADAVQEMLLARLLLALDHPYREELDAPVHSWGPGPARRMVDAIEASPRHPFTVAELSDVAGVSVPVLRECCRRHLDTSPTQQLRSIRLTRARRELTEADFGWTSVAGVASGWGFTNTGRFVADFENRYGEPPWQTLRGPAYA